MAPKYFSLNMTSHFLGISQGSAYELKTISNGPYKITASFGFDNFNGLAARWQQSSKFKINGGILP